MKHHDYKQIYSRWQKEQQFIRKKFQIPYNMTYTFRQCHDKFITHLSKQTEQIMITTNNRKRQTQRREQHCFKNDLLIPPIFCSKCHLNPMKCLCKNGLGQWWINLHKRSSLSFQENLIEKKSLSNSISTRYVNFETSFIDLSSIEQSTSRKLKDFSHQSQYVLLNWNDRQSLLNFLKTTQSIRNISNRTIEQLREQITTNTHIHFFDSISDLLLTMTEKQQRISLCQIYIDPSYYSTLKGTNPLSQSQLIADNNDLHRTLYSVQKIAILLGLKIDSHINEFSFENLSTKQRKSILNQQSLFLTSKMPSNIFRNSSIPIH